MNKILYSIVCIGILYTPAFGGACTEGSESAAVMTDDFLLAKLGDYSSFLVGLQTNQQPLRDEDALFWISELEDAIDQSTNALVIQSGLVSVMSLHNQLHNWGAAEQTCTRAYLIALDEKTRVERLGDLFAIQTAQSLEENSPQRVAGDRWKTFQSLDTEFRKFVEVGGIEAVENPVFGLYCWALDSRIRADQSAENLEGVAKNSDWILELYGDADIRDENRVQRHVFRHYRALAASSHLKLGSVDSALASLQGGKQYPVDTGDAALAYELADGVRFELKSEFVSRLDYLEVDHIDALKIAVLHARDAMKQLQSENDGELMQGFVVIEDHNVVHAFMLLEDVVSMLLSKEPSLTDRVPLSAHLPVEHKKLLALAANMLVDFLVLDEQETVAEKYIALMKQKIPNTIRD